MLFGRTEECVDILDVYLFHMAWSTNAALMVWWQWGTGLRPWIFPGGFIIQVVIITILSTDARSPLLFPLH